MSDARPSNAGDRFHFVYAARRLLDMLPPNSKLSLIQMENISKVDQRLVDNPDDLLGVDLSEYYGGNTFNTASSIVLTQVKYSALHQDQAWTLARLSQNKQSSKGGDLPGTSVLRKLANMFDVVYREIGESCRNKVCIRLVTDQFLNQELKDQLAFIQDNLGQNIDLNDNDSGQLLQKLIDTVDGPLISLSAVTNLSWKRLSVFLRCWDLSTFGQGMSTQQETDFVQLLDHFVDAGIYFGNLINFVEEHALPHRRTDMTREQVYGLLRIRETSFFPSPARFENTENLQLTENVVKLRNLLEQTPHSVILMHGLSGTGKSSTLQLLQQNDLDRKAIVIYDCFGNGQGVGLDTRRFPFKNFYVQLINELALKFDTNLYVTTQIDSDEIRQRFNLAISRAASVAQLAGKKLIIAVDAIDDAAEAALEQPNLQDESFVPTLWQIRWPENCTLIITSRTENRYLLDIKCIYSEIEVLGFSPKEGSSFIRTNQQMQNEELIRFAYERTQGNPRVLTKILAAIEREQPD